MHVEMYMLFFYGLALRGVTHDHYNCTLNKSMGMHVEMYMHFFLDSSFEERHMTVTIVC